MTTEAKEKPQSQDTPLEKPGQTSADTKSAPKTISEEAFLKAISDERAASGRLKAQVDNLTKERDTLKNQLTEATTDVEVTKERLTTLESDLETLADENAPAAEIAKMRRRVEATEAQLKKDIRAKQDALDELTRTAQSEREQFAETVAEAQAIRFHADVFEVAEEYGGGKVYDQLKSLCDTIVETTGKTIPKESIQNIAGRHWEKKGKAEDSEPDLLVDSGVTTGGTGLGNLPPAELLKEVQKKVKS